MFDADQRLIVCNQRYLEMFRFSPDVVKPGISLSEILEYSASLGNYSEAERDKALSERSCLAERREEATTLQWLRDGRVIAVMHRPMEDGGSVATYEDVTALKQHEAELTAMSAQLRDQNMRFDAALTNIAQGLCMFDADQRLIVCNQRYLEMFGFDPEIVKPGITLSEIMAYSVSIGNYSKAEADRAVDERPSHAASKEEGTIFQRLRDGRVIAVMHRPMTGGGSVATYDDVTQQEADATALRIANEQAIAASHANEFLNNTSHELRTPLNAIIGFSEVIEQECLGPIGTGAYVEYAQNITRSGRHLLQLINDILDLSVVSSGREELDECVLEVAALVAAFEKIVVGRAERESVAVTFEVEESPPSLRGDDRKLKQILINLLSNAIKFTEPGGQVLFRTWSCPDTGIVFQIKDTGIGIAPDDIPFALAPFRQIDDSLRRKYEGTGLGLPLAKTLTELHGGTLDLQSRLGVGTTVTVRLPAARLIVREPVAL